MTTLDTIAATTFDDVGESYNNKTNSFFIFNIFEF